MERKKTVSSMKALEESVAVSKEVPVEVVNIAQIRRLVQLLDGSDVSELELKQPGEDFHLVLRKVRASDSSPQASEIVPGAASGGVKAANAGGEATRQNVVASLVGIFHPWLKPRGSTLVTVGDLVKAGQLVGTIESLNVFTEVETQVAGRVVEIHVVDSQPVEYGQVLITIEPDEVEEI